MTPGGWKDRQEQGAGCPETAGGTPQNLFSSPLSLPWHLRSLFSPMLLVKPDIWPSVPPQLGQMVRAKAAQAVVTRDPAGAGAG